MLLPGKIPYVKKAELKVAISAGTMIDYSEWVPSHKHDTRFNYQYPSPYKHLRIQIRLDDNVLLEQSLDSPVEFSYMFEDSEDITEHFLKITLSGVNDLLRPELENTSDFSPMAKIDGVWIEGLLLKQAFEEYGTFFLEDSNITKVPSEFIGQNGTHVLNFKTPIYHWLLGIEKNLNYFRL